MKTNWKIALMCITMLAMIACKPKNPADQPGTGGQQGRPAAGDPQRGYSLLEPAGPQRLAVSGR